jgi:hypothetical protein
MSVIATAVKHLLAAGVTGEALVNAIAEMEAAQPKDAAAERRRAWDRERKRGKRSEGVSTGIPPESADNADNAGAPSLSRPPNENNSNPPTHTHPDISTPRARSDPFPRPEWADPQHWTDLKANRKAKRLPNTPTAYAKFQRDIEKWVDGDWPPGRVLEAIAARGWASAEHDPRGSQTNGLPARQADIRRAAVTSRGDRPNPCLDMLYAAEAEIRASEDPQPDLGTRPALRAIQ